MFSDRHRPSKAPKIQAPAKRHRDASASDDNSYYQTPSDYYDSDLEFRVCFGSGDNGAGATCLGWYYRRLRHRAHHIERGHVTCEFFAPR